MIGTSLPRPAVRAVGMVALCLLLGPARAADAATGGRPADAAALTRLIDGFLATEALARPSAHGRAVLVQPVVDSDAGPVAGQAFSRLTRDLDRVVLLSSRAGGAPAEAAPGTAIAIPTWESMRTALGDVPVDTEAVQACRTRAGDRVTDRTGAADRAFASVLPFLQRRLPKPFTLVPLAADAGADPSVLVDLLKPLLARERTALVVLVADRFTSGDLQAVFAPDEVTPAVGTASIPAHLLATRAIASEMGWKPAATGHAESADRRPLLSAVLVEDANRLDLLAQASKATWEDPVTRAAFADANRASDRLNFQGDLLSQPEQELLLGLARKSILSKLRGEAPPAPPLYSDTLARPAGCFVTLNQAGKLRGCIGTILPKEPLGAAVQRNALAAAFEDKRFQPVTAEEMAGIEVVVSVLTPPTKVEYRDGNDLLGKLKPGVHGVLLTYENSKRATFLPQVWSQFPEKDVFLKALCRKAAIPLDAWQDPAKTTIETYESFDFSDKAR